MASSDNARKLLVRTALVTGTTVATLFGAQTLALMDTQTFSEILTPEAVTNPADTFAEPDIFVVSPTTTVTIQRAAPSVTILRRPGSTVTDAQATAPQSNGTSLVIQPPSPVVLAAPAPVIVQQAGGQQVASSGPAPVVVQQPPRTRTRPSR